ncbi:MAG: polysaccharide biosynthesis C-terminal domain-containing protein [Candidatus Cloacimonetes bacterium]|nr:polysaccharide biosynthesis C-terminal domain-containing protein [Candidatus Cloacimonadota bacterium]
MILSRYFTKTDYGTYRQFWLFGFTLIPIFLLGIPSSITYFIAGAKSQHQKTAIINSFIISTAMTVFVGLLFFLLRNEFIVIIKNQKLIKFIFPLIILQIFAPMFYLYQPILVSLKKYKLVVLISVITSIIILLYVIAIVFTNSSFEIFLPILSIVMVFNAIVIFVIIYSISGIKKVTINWQSIKNQIVFSAPLGLALFLGIISKQLDKFLVSYFTNSETFAIYANGAVELPFINLITNSVMAILLPEYVRLWKEKNQSRIINIWNNSIIKTATIIVPIMIFSMVMHREIITILFSSKYVNSAIIFFIYLFILPMRLATFGSILIAIGKTKTILKYTIIAVVINFVFSIIGFHYCNVSGIAIATVISIYIINIGQMYEISKSLNLNFFQLIPSRQLSKILFISFIPAIIIYFLSFSHLGIFLNFIIKFSLFFIIYGGIYEKVIFTRISK